MPCTDHVFSAGGKAEEADKKRAKEKAVMWPLTSLLLEMLGEMELVLPKEDNVTECLALIRPELPWKQLLEVSFIVFCWDKIIPGEDSCILCNIELKDLRAFSSLVHHITPTHALDQP